MHDDATKKNILELIKKQQCVNPEQVKLIDNVASILIFHGLKASDLGGGLK